MTETGSCQADHKSILKIFDSRHEGDYQPLRVFQAEEVNLYLEQCAGFIARLETLLGR